MQKLKTFLKALAIMTLAGVGVGGLVDGIKRYDQAGTAGLGAFLLIGAFFLYRMWFAQR